LHKTTEDDPEISQMAGLSQNCARWMEDAKRVAIGNFKPTNEDGNEVYSGIDSEAEGNGEDDSKDMPKDTGGRSHMTQKQIFEWYRSYDGGSQLQSETQAGPQVTVADSRPSGFEGFTTQARPRETVYVGGSSSPFPDPGTAAGSCEPTT
jgi:hypothetical protein